MQKDSPASLRSCGLESLGWSAGRNVQIDTRWAARRADNFHTYAEELLALEPDVIVGVSTPAVTALQQASRGVPIVFVGVVDPVGSGLVASLARPDGNAIRRPHLEGREAG